MRRFIRRNRWMGLLASFFMLLAALSPAAAGQAIPDSQDSAVAVEDVFERLDGSTFYFLSGAGAWSTELVVSPDGSFTGYYHDTDMGDSGIGYPNGTRYECDFSGTFALVEQSDEFTYILRLTSLALKEEPGKERVQSIEDRERFDDTTKCILCAACTTSCPVFWTDGQYFGPAAIVNAHRFIFDSRDDQAQVRLDILNDTEGVWRCRTTFNCTDACPRGIQVTKAIAEVKAAIRSGKTK